MLTSAWPGFIGTPAFDGYPYLVTRIGASALRHLAVLPADWSRDHLIDLLKRQAATNQLPTCLVLGRSEAVYVPVDRERDLAGQPATSSIVPTGLPVVGCLQLPPDVPVSDDLAARRLQLLAFAKQHAGTGYIVGDNLEGGREASGEDVVRLTGVANAPGPGLTPCPRCGELQGERLQVGAPGDRHPGPRVIRVHCRCANHNRCARCGGTLADRRLSAYFWDAAKPGVWYVAAYSGLSHRCYRSRGRAAPSDPSAGRRLPRSGPSFPEARESTSDRPSSVWKETPRGRLATVFVGLELGFKAVEELDELAQLVVRAELNQAR